MHCGSGRPLQSKDERSNRPRNIPGGAGIFALEPSAGHTSDLLDLRDSLCGHLIERVVDRRLEE